MGLKVAVEYPFFFRTSVIVFLLPFFIGGSVDVRNDGTEYGVYGALAIAVLNKIPFAAKLSNVGVIFFWNQIRYFLYTTDSLPAGELEARWEIEKELFDKADEY